MSRRLAAVVMAAGLGKRMKSACPKVLHPVAGRPMVLYMAALARRVADAEVVIVVGHGAKQVRSVLEEAGPEIAPYAVVEQVQQRGTGHAVEQARKLLVKGRKCLIDRCLILNGDTPLLTEATVRALLQRHQKDGAAVTILSATVDDPQGYGRVIRGTRDEVLRIVEDRDASSRERRIAEVNVGTYVVEGDFLFRALTRLEPRNAQAEYYLTDIVGLAVKEGLRVSALVAEDSTETLGVNDREHLAFAEKRMRSRLCKKWMKDGVTLLDPERTTIDEAVVIGKDTVIYPGVSLEGRTRLGEGCQVRSYSRIADSTLGDRVLIQDHSVVNGARLESETVVGPFAHLRPGTELCRRSKVGNFVELKQTVLGEGSKANHLTYLGDARIGRDVNVGAGTITCNYDGYRKAQTVVEDRVFIGSDTQLIAPIRVGQGAIVAAGTTLTRDVPPDALAIARPNQVIREGAASRRRSLYAPSASSGTPLQKGSRKITRAKKKA